VDGAGVAFTYATSGAKAQELVREVEAGGGNAIAFKADSGSAEELQNVVNQTVASALNQLEQERIRLGARLHGLTEAISALTGVSQNRRGRLSSAGRARIAAAQRARWANAKGERGVSSARRKS
jgi:hypothetical protein